MSKSDKSKSTNICILIINTQSIKLEETEELKVASCFWGKLEGIGTCGAFCYM